MIVIKSIGWVEVEGDTYNSQESTPNYLVMPSDVLDGGIISMVYGKRYRRADGTEIVLGNAPRVEELIGTQLEEVDKLVREIDKYKKDIDEMEKERTSLIEHIWRLDDEVKELNGMGLWKRLGYAFQLIKPSLLS